MTPQAAVNPSEKKDVPFYTIKSPSDAIERKVFLDEVLDMTKDVWKKDRALIISLSGLQKIADVENIVEKNFAVSIVPSKLNHQQHVVTVWLGFKGDDCKDNWVRGSGEASILNTGVSEEIADDAGNLKEIVHKEHDSIDSQYKFAMAEKRAFSRAMKRMIRLYGVYSEVEASSFKKPPEKQDSSGSENYDY